MSIDQELRRRVAVESQDDTRHKIANDDEITDADAKAFDGDCRIEHNRCIGICDLTERKEAS